MSEPMSAPIVATASGTRVVHLAEVASTNTDAMQRAAAGDRGPVWVVADRQTAGRGRSGQPWASPPGNLYATRLAVLTCDPARLPQLSLVAGIAVIDAIRSVGGSRISGLRLKWPNDILVGAEKLGGILVESTTIGTRTATGIGIGLNLTSHPVGLSYAATCLAHHGVTTDRRAMLDALDRELDLWLMNWRDGIGAKSTRAAWLARAGPIGERLRVHTAVGLVEGMFAGIDDDGALLLLDSGGAIARHTYGDVSLAATPPS